MKTNTVNSEAKKTFNTLPVIETQALADNDGPQMILLIEDNQAEASLLKERLKRIFPDAQISVGSTLAEGLQHMRRYRFDLLLLDLGLPDAQGVESLTKITQQGPELAIVVVTGNENPELVAKVLLNGAQDYLVKGRVDSINLKRAANFAWIRKRQQVVDAQVRRMTEASPDGMLVCDYRGRVVQANTAACELLNLDLSQVLSHEIEGGEITLPQRWQQVEAQGTSSWSAQHMGKPVNFLAQCMPGFTQQYMVFIRDNDRPAEEKLSVDRHPQHRVILDLTHDALLLIDAQGAILGMSQAACILLGCTEQKVQGANLASIILSKQSTHQFFALDEQGDEFALSLEYADCKDGENDFWLRVEALAAIGQKDDPACMATLDAESALNSPEANSSLAMAQLQRLEQSAKRYHRPLAALGVKPAEPSDAALNALDALLQQSLRECDLVLRGEDGLLVLMPETEVSGASLLADRIIADARTLEDELVLKSRISQWMDGEDDINSLLGRVSQDA